MLYFSVENENLPNPLLKIAGQQRRQEMVDVEKEQVYIFRSVALKQCKLNLFWMLKWKLNMFWMLQCKLNLFSMLWCKLNLFWKLKCNLFL